jgi:hypothetical protein
MKWLVDNNKVFQQKEDRWLLTWIELDKEKSHTNVTPYGIAIYYCNFCGKKIKNIGG